MSAQDTKKWLDDSKSESTRRLRQVSLVGELDFDDDKVDLALSPDVAPGCWVR